LNEGPALPALFFWADVSAARCWCRPGWLLVLPACAVIALLLRLPVDAPTGTAAGDSAGRTWQQHTVGQERVEQQLIAIQCDNRKDVPGAVHGATELRRHSHGVIHDHAAHRCSLTHIRVGPQAINQGPGS